MGNGKEIQLLNLIYTKNYSCHKISYESNKNMNQLLLCTW